MKLAVYAIAKNEEKNINRWLEAISPELRPGDSLTVLDTGSEDQTVPMLMDMASCSCTKIPVRIPETVIKPWRFDVARNTALAMADPEADLAWSLDLDEVPQPGWREAIEEGWEEGAIRLRYPFVWNFLPNGKPGITFYADKLHTRHGFVWKGIAHEWLAYEGKEAFAWSETLKVHHYQDGAVNRTERDTALMARAIKEQPNDPRLQHYWARQLLWTGKPFEASEWFQKHLANPEATWRHERSQSMIYLSRTGGNAAWRRQWVYRALAECPERRETHYEAAKLERDEGNDALAIAHARNAIHTPKDTLYLSDPEAEHGPMAIIEECIARVSGVVSAA